MLEKFDNLKDRTFNFYKIKYNVDYKKSQNTYLGYMLNYFHFCLEQYKEPQIYNFGLNLLYDILNFNEITSKIKFDEMTKFETMKKFNIQPFDIPTDDYDYTKWPVFYWNYLHYLGLYIGDNEKATFRLGLFLIYFDNFLICSTCWYNYRNKPIYLKIVAPLLSGQNAAIAIFDLHNLVNKSINKPIFTIDEYLKRYDGVLIESTTKYIKDEYWKKYNEFSHFKA